MAISTAVAVAHSIVLAPHPPGIFSLQKAAQGVSGEDHTIQLYGHACNATDPVSLSSVVHTNCTIACSDPHVVWRDMYTLHNCLAQPAISRWLSAYEESISSRKREIGGPVEREPVVLDEMSAEIAMQMGFRPSWDMTGHHDLVWGKCLRGWCEAAGVVAGVKTSKKAPKKNCTEIGRGDRTTPAALLDAACSNFIASPNTDVGGVGVYIGYLMQLGILAYAYLHTRLMSTWIRWITYAVYLPSGLQKARQRATQVQEKLDSTNQQAAMLSSLVEFQKGQAYFNLTQSASSVAALAGSGKMFSSDSLQQLHTTIYLVGDVAGTGIISITFGLYLLHTAEKRSWYTSILSVLAVLVCVISWVQTRSPLQTFQTLMVDKIDLPICGNISPAVYCLKNTESRGATIFEAVSICICLLTLTSILVRQRGARQRNKTPWDESLTSSDEPASTSAAALAERVRFLYDWRLEISEAVHLSLAIGMLVQMVTNGEIEAMRTQQVRWSFAQLIAVTIWAPVGVEYVYAAIKGVEAMQKHRVLRDEEDDDDE